MLCLELSFFFPEPEKKQPTFDSIQNSSIYRGFINRHLKLYFSTKNSPLNYITETISNCLEISFTLGLEHINQQVFNKQYKDVKNLLRQFSNNSICKISQQLKKVRQDRTQQKNNQAVQLIPPCWERQHYMDQTQLYIIFYLTAYTPLKTSSDTTLIKTHATGSMSMFSLNSMDHHLLQ